MLIEGAKRIEDFIQMFSGNNVNILKYTVLLLNSCSVLTSIKSFKKLIDDI